MAQAERPPAGYEDRLIHLAKQPHDLLMGWVIVGGLAAGIVFGFWHHPPLGFGPEPTLVRGETKIDPLDRPLLQAKGAPLVDEFGIPLKRAD